MAPSEPCRGLGLAHQRSTSVRLIPIVWTLGNCGTSPSCWEPCDAGSIHQTSDGLMPFMVLDVDIAPYIIGAWTPIDVDMGNLNSFFGQFPKSLYSWLALLFSAFCLNIPCLGSDRCKTPANCILHCDSTLRTLCAPWAWSITVVCCDAFPVCRKGICKYLFPFLFQSFAPIRNTLIISSHLPHAPSIKHPGFILFVMNTIANDVVTQRI